MEELSNPIIIEFPLRGEWAVPNTPGTRIPSHGTNLFGTRFAYDFLQVDYSRKGNPCYRTSLMHYLFLGIPLNKCYCYKKEIYAPCAGTIIEIVDNFPEREKLSFYFDYRKAKNNRSTSNVKSLTGNYIILKHSNGVYVAFCHLLPASITVSVGQVVKKGEILGRIGHSGNSMFPHLHFQLMDSPNISVAKGRPCAFEQYEVFKNGQWVKVYDSIPKSTDRIRFQKF